MRQRLALGHLAMHGMDRHACLLHDMLAMELAGHQGRACGALQQHVNPDSSVDMLFA